MNVAQGLGGAAGSERVEPGTFKVQKSSAFTEADIKRLLREELQKVRGQKLTWNRNQPPEVPNDLTTGLLNKRLAYMGPFGGRFYIQNGKILDANGTEVSLSDVPDELYRWRDMKSGVEHVAPSDRTTIRAAYERHLRDAIQSDPMLCPVAADYRATDNDDRMRHIFKVHPIEFADIVGLPDAPIELDAQAIPSPLEAQERLEAELPPPPKNRGGRPRKQPRQPDAAE